jgi:hypothetical protein
MIADTNVLISSVLDDDVAQSRAMRLALSSADQVVISRHAFCEDEYQATSGAAISCL